MLLQIHRWIVLSHIYIDYVLRAGVPSYDILCCYNSVIPRSFLGYACSVWRPGLTKSIKRYASTKTPFKTIVLIPLIFYIMK